MADFIVRTNPTQKNGQLFCSQCRKIKPSVTAAIKCAKGDFKRRTGRDADERVTV